MLSVTPLGKLVITSSEDGTVRVWDPKAATTIVHLQGNYYYYLFQKLRSKEYN